MSEWNRVAACADVSTGKAIVVEHAGEGVAVFNVGGTYYACSDACPHAGGPLHLSMIRGTVISCPWHGWTFDLNAAPGAPRDGVLRYPVKIENGEILLGPA